MSSIIILPLALLIYIVLIYWLLKRFNFKQIWLGPYSHSENYVNSPLTVIVKRSLDFFMILFLLIAFAIPIIVVIMAISQNEIATWGVDIGVFSGFKLDLNQLPGVEVLGVRHHEFSGQSIISIDTSNLYAWYLFVIVSEISALVAVYVTVQCRNIVLSLQANKSFIQENSDRIKNIGIVVIAWNLINPLVQYFGWGSVIKTIIFNNNGIMLYPAFEINIIALLIGLMLFLLARMLKEAAMIKQEQELTI
jgi:hypothetical protein